MTQIEPTRRNFRFWTYTPFGWVKLTLRPEQSIRICKHSTDGEGWSKVTEVFSHEGIGVLLRYKDEGRDCDGCISTGGAAFCPAEKLKARTPYHEEGTPKPDFMAADFDPVGDDWQRDENAELAGY